MQPTTPLNELLIEASRLDDTVHTTRESVARPLGLSVAQGRVLQRVAESPRTVATLARRLGLKRQSVQRIADLLVRDGVIELRDNPDHKRAKLLALTSDGQQRLEALQAAEESWLAALGSELEIQSDADDLQPAIELLRLVREAVEARSPQEEDTP